MFTSIFSANRTVPDILPINIYEIMNKCKAVVIVIDIFLLIKEDLLVYNIFIKIIEHDFCLNANRTTIVLMFILCTS